MNNQGSLLGGVSKTVQSNTLLSQGIAGNAFAPFESGRPRQAAVDPLNLYGGNNPEPPAAPEPPPVVPPPTPMPTVGDQQTENARRQSLEDQATRRGRLATVLTSSSNDRLGS